MKAITVYETKDGRTFANELEACWHELALDIAALLKESFPGASIPFLDDIARMIARNLDVSGPQSELCLIKVALTKVPR